MRRKCPIRKKSQRISRSNERAGAPCHSPKYIHDLMRMYLIRFSELSRLPIPMAWKGCDFDTFNARSTKCRKSDCKSGVHAV